MSESTQKPAFREVLQLRNRCIENAVALKPLLEEFKENVNQFYKTMRWQGIDCSEAEYALLFENFAWEYENDHIETATERLAKFLTLLSQQSPAASDVDTRK